MSINIVPKIGDNAIGETLPFEYHGTAYVKRVEGEIEDVKNGLYKIRDYNFLFPLHRILVFTFGGIPIQNPSYDKALVDEENRKEIERLNNSNN